MSINYTRPVLRSSKTTYNIPLRPHSLDPWHLSYELFHEHPVMVLSSRTHSPTYTGKNLPSFLLSEVYQRYLPYGSHKQTAMYCLVSPSTPIQLHSPTSVQFSCYADEPRADQSNIPCTSSVRELIHERDNLRALPLSGIQQEFLRLLQNSVLNPDRPFQP